MSMTLWTLLQVSINARIAVSRPMLGADMTTFMQVETEVLLMMQAVLLFVNGLAVLNNERFLEPCTSSPAALHASLIFRARL